MSILIFALPDTQAEQLCELLKRFGLTAQDYHLQESLHAEFAQAALYLHWQQHPLLIAENYQQRAQPLSLGLAQWERHSLRSLQHSQEQPRLILHADAFAAAPIAQAWQLYQDLFALGLSGLIFPPESELHALFSAPPTPEEADFLHWANPAQIALYQGLRSGEALDWSPLPPLSPAAADCLALQQQCQQLQQQLSVQRQQQQSQQRQLRQQLHQSRDWLRQCFNALDALFASLSWRLGYAQTRLLQKLLRRAPSATVREHIEQLREYIRMQTTAPESREPRQLKSATLICWVENAAEIARAEKLSRQLSEDFPLLCLHPPALVASIQNLPAQKLCSAWPLAQGRSLNLALAECTGDVLLLDIRAEFDPAALPHLLQALSAQAHHGIAAALCNLPGAQALPCPEGVAVQAWAQSITSNAAPRYPRQHALHSPLLAIKKEVLAELGDLPLFADFYAALADYQQGAADAGWHCVAADALYAHCPQGTANQAAPAYLAQQRLMLQNQTPQDQTPQNLTGLQDLSGLSALPKVSLIMLVRNQAQLTWQCLESLRLRTDYPDYELLLIDNDSDAETKAMLQRAAQANPRLRLFTNPENRSFSAANNQGAAEAQGELLLLINNDIEAQQDDWLRVLVQALLAQPTCVAVGPELRYPSGKVQSAGVRIDWDAASGDLLGAAEIRSPQPSRTVDALTAACLLIWKDIYQAVGGLDERYWYGQEDVDLCLKLRHAGFELRFVAETQLIHHESATRKLDQRSLENREKIRAAWVGRVDL